MYKIVSLVKRKAGTTHQQFKDYYETTHCKFGDKYLPPYCTKYLRRYVDPLGHPITGTPAGSDFDCITEMWFASEADYKAFTASVAKPEIAKEVVADEEKFVDRAGTRRYLVEEEQLAWGPP
jgi:EthD domain